MRRRLAVSGTLVLGAWVLFASYPVWGHPEFSRQTKAACEACHASIAGGAELTAAGKAFKTSKAAVPTTAKQVEYVGANKCKTCHMKQHKAWLTTAHAEAWHGLTNADEKKIAEMAATLKIQANHPATKSDGCVQCHVTGFGLAGGYPGTDSTKTAALQNVTCESCHGPGSKHIAAPMADKKKMITKNLTEATCRQCHTPQTSPNFKFEEFKKKGVHAVAG